MLKDSEVAGRDSLGMMMHSGSRLPLPFASSLHPYYHYPEYLQDGGGGDGDSFPLHIL